MENNNFTNIGKFNLSEVSMVQIDSILGWYRYNREDHKIETFTIIRRRTELIKIFLYDKMNLAKPSMSTVPRSLISDLLTITSIILRVSLTN